MKGGDIEMDIESSGISERVSQINDGDDDSDVDMNDFQDAIQNDRDVEDSLMNIDITEFVDANEPTPEAESMLSSEDESDSSIEIIDEKESGRDYMPAPIQSAISLEFGQSNQSEKENSSSLLSEKSNISSEDEGTNVDPVSLQNEDDIAEVQIESESASLIVNYREQTVERRIHLQF